MKILAVDDDELILELLTDSLAAHGFKDTTTICSAKTALDLLTKMDTETSDSGAGNFDCILLDIEMPEMSGIELCRLIRNIPAYYYTPIVIVTTRSDRKFIDHAFAAGATDYVTKPFKKAELVERVRMAETLVREQENGLQSYFLKSPLYSGLDSEKGALFEVPIVVEGVSRVVDFLVLENYLARLSRKVANATIAVAFKYATARDDFLELGVELFYERLERVAQTIAKSLDGTEYLLAYFGSGLFVCVTDASDTFMSAEIGPRMELIANDEFSASDNFRPTIIMGHPVENPIGFRKRAQSMLLEAVVSAAKRSSEFDGGPLARVSPDKKTAQSLFGKRPAPKRAGQPPRKMLLSR